MDDDEVACALKQLLPMEGFRHPSSAGLAGALKGAVEQAPERFAGLLPRLHQEGVDIIYPFHVLLELKEVLGKGGNLNWEPVFDFCERFLEDPRQEEDEGGHTRSSDVRQHITGLIQAGMLQDDHAFPPVLLDQAREILLRLVDDPNPTPEEEAQAFSGIPFRAVTASLNCVRGAAMHALVVYALRRARIEHAAGSEGVSGIGRLEPVVKRVLTRKLDKGDDPSPAVHSVFGQYLPQLVWLDEAWVIENLGRIFPESETYWTAAWEAYVGLSRGPLARLHSHLREHYRRAILSMGHDGTRDRVSQHLSDHLMLLYLWKREDIGTEDSLIDLFYAKAPQEARAGAVWFLWRVLEDARPASDSELWSLLRVLWEARVNAALASGDRGQFDAELSAFAWWLNAMPEDLPGVYGLVEAIVRFLKPSTQEKHVLDYLAREVESYPVLVSRLMRLMAQNVTGSWYLRRQSVVRQVLRNAIVSGDVEAKTEAHATINILGEQGDYSYRDLLDL